MPRTRSMVRPVPVSRFAALALALVASVAALAAPARADDTLQSINAQFRAVPESRRSDLKVLPLLADLADPPRSLETRSPAWVTRPAERAALLSWKGPNWSDWKAWAQGAPQQALLAVLPEITAEGDYRRAYAFAQPYGVEGVSVDLISKGMYTDLGDPPLLARAQHLYMPKMEHFETLAHVEASRLMEEGRADDAVKLMADWSMFARQFADRPMLKEKRWALDALELGLVRMRDLAYEDFRAPERKTTSATLVDIVDRFKFRNGYLDLDRLQLPVGEFAAKAQLIDRVMTRGGGANAEFARELARITTVDRPLRRFAAAAYWEGMAAGHANELDTRRQLQRIRDDWTRRWSLSPFDPILDNRTDYQKNVRGRPQYALLDAGVGTMEELFPLRQRLRVESAGTRMGLAVYAFVLTNRNLPPGLAAVRPTFTKGAPLDTDPYTRQRADIQYFVPMRDTPRDEHGREKMYRVSLFPPAPHPEFEVPFARDQFILYSTGPSGVAGMAATVTQDRRGVPGDYLLWPPLMSLERTLLIERGQLR